MHLYSLLILLLSKSVLSFVYSCEEVLFQLMNSTFEQHAQVALLYTQDGFSNSDQLDNLYLVSGNDQYKFTDIVDKSITKSEEPWKIVGNDPQMECPQEFILIFTTESANISKLSKGVAPYSKKTETVFASPQNGMWLNINAINGEGNFTIYTGAGTGEKEDKYLLQSWPCEAMPDWIISFDNVITFKVDGSCAYSLECSSDFADDIFVYRTDWIVILSSGRSSNAQNRENLDLKVKIGIADWKRSIVDAQMQITLDADNSGSIQIQKTYEGGVSGYRVDMNETFYTNYFECSVLRAIVSNKITMTDAVVYDCPEEYSLIPSDTGDNWCYVIIWPTPPHKGFNFQDSVTTCQSRDDFLPILTSDKMNYEVASFTEMHNGVDSFWIGITCDTGPSCNGVESFALFYDDNSWRQYSHGKSFDFVACARRAFPSTMPTARTHIHRTTTAPTSRAINVGSTENIASTESETSTTEYFISIDSTTAMNIIGTVPTTSTQTSTTLEITATSTPPKSSGLPLWAIILIAVGVLFICGCFIGVILFARRKITSQKARFVEEIIAKEKKLNENSSRRANNHRYYDTPGRNNEWEIERIFVGIDYLHKLGEGAFGSVFMGRVLAKNIPSVMGRSIVELSALTNEDNTVAVKMLHENADAQRVHEFRAEIDLMQRIGYHERLVNMLACVTLSDPILLICEYCANGDLLEYLRKKRKFMLENPNETDAGKVITVEKQLMFAIQIAYGLEYLSSCGFIHRDIAARNIMLDQQERCKIGDFGLARSVEGENDNYHAQGGKLPLKWMSPEAIDKYYFSSAADVWSFGVLLFEIVTLGGTPYAGWPVGELLSRLKRNERMERPDNCSESLYEVMCVCWSEQPSDRPTFTELRKHLGDLLEEVNKDEYYLKLNADANYYVLESNASD